MEVKEIQNKNIEKIVDVICDCCGKSCRVYTYVIDNPVRHDHGETHHVFEFMKLQSSWGYYSGKDTEKWSAQVCEKCVDEKFKFINFKKEEYL